MGLILVFSGLGHRRLQVLGVGVGVGESAGGHGVGIERFMCVGAVGLFGRTGLDLRIRGCKLSLMTSIVWTVVLSILVL